MSATPGQEGHLTIEHSGREQRWVADLPAGVTDVAGYEYVRWVCSCGEQSEPFIDRDNECEMDWRRHAGIDREPDLTIGPAEGWSS